MQVQGIISGKYIKLFHETNLPDGSVVIVNIQSNQSSLEEKINLIDKLCGSWANDESINLVFNEIEEQRHKNRPREINWLNVHLWGIGLRLPAMS
jgi:nitrate reductase NapAB chaperone NapD